MSFESINPNNGEPIARWEETPEAEVDAALDAGHQAQRDWRRESLDHRARCLRRAAELLARDREAFALRITREMGKPLDESRAEIDKCAWVCRHYADNGAEDLAPEPVASDASRSYVRFDPLGLVLAVMPWNFPFWQVFRFAAPALMAGNGGVLKHASNVCGCAEDIAGVFARSGFPAGLFCQLRLGSDRVGDLIADPRIAAVTVTGSPRAGAVIAARAGAHLKKTVLELGGSDPFLVLPDADLDEAVVTAVRSRTLCSGQSCIAAKRFLVARSQLADFETRMTTAMQALVVGDPEDPATDVGPQARDDLRRELHRQVTESVEAGARLLTGGEIPTGPGYFYPPTVLSEPPDGTPARDEELFGPAATILPYDTEDEAVELANATPYGLGAAVFTSDLARGEALARRLDAGSCFVNGLVKSDPRLPFGGIKASGYGRELGRFGLREFVNVKTVWVR